MMTTNQEYWQRRYLQTKAKEIRATEAYEKSLQPELNGLFRELNGEVSKWVDKYAKNQGIDSDAARKALDGIHTKHWQMTLKQFREKAKAGGYEDELDAEYFRSRVALLQALEQQLRSISQPRAQSLTDSMRDKLADQYDDTYMRTNYNLQAQRASFSADFAHFNDVQLRMAVSQPWGKDGKDFSQRIWKNYQRELPSYLMDAVLRGTIMGYGPHKVTQMMHARFQDVKRNNVHRLVVSEMAHVAEEANVRAYEENEIEQYEYMATLESHTCAICAKLDGQIFKVSERRPGINYPIIHGRCRCTTIPYLKDLPDIKERWSRDPVTGKGKMVKDVKFNKWKKSILAERERAASAGDFGANLEYVRSQEFEDKLKRNPRTAKISDAVAVVARHMIQHRNGTPFEDYYLLDSDTGATIAVSNKATVNKGVVYNAQVKQAFKSGSKGQYVSIHNHPSGFPPSLSDVATLTLKSKEKTIGMGLTVGHDGSVYWYTSPSERLPFNANLVYGKQIQKYVKMGYNEIKSQELALMDFADKYAFEFGKVGDDDD
ncbi:minor capsid protein [Levilactobacillus namurensis]|uniref:minor capsid protein n=1 Tax=Levilactobacillus namurensis TaxID=380393 RepID=UPI0028BDF3A4|nr:minor capsid protein [Levilactobacillus namurensis]WNN66088.1 minor capsid protein [Levilactobacillus namurensis]